MNTNRRQFNFSLLAASLAWGAGTARSASMTESSKTASLDFNPDTFESLEVGARGQSVRVRAYEGLPTVLRPLEPEYQSLNLYIPEAYFSGGRVGKYDATTAPIFLPNKVGGYMPAKPGKAIDNPTGQPPAPGPQSNAVAMALARGFVVACPGARGRTLRAADGTWTGKAPAAIVDLKAAVRWLRHNAKRMPGNTERIVSNGTSAGGALSALLGASGNHADFDKDLLAMGAAQQRDDIFAVSSYCPITNLEHANGAYEWQFHGIAEYKNVAITMLDFQVQRKETTSYLNASQLALSTQLRSEFIRYVNTLSLHDAQGQLLRLRPDGTGTLQDQVRALLIASAQRAQAEGTDLSAHKGLQFVNGRVMDVDFNTHIQTMGRMKALPAFDGFSLETGENQLFGTAQTDKQHFTAFGLQHSTVPDASKADAQLVRKMNAMHYAQQSDTASAPHWRIRHGTMDKDTSFAIPTLLAAALTERKLDVDLAFPWNRPHSGDYDLEELMDWIERRI